MRLPLSPAARLGAASEAASGARDKVFAPLPCGTRVACLTVTVLW